MRFPNPIVSLLVLLVRCYKLFVSPWVPASCRYYPTCSEYTIQALRRHGPVKGLFLSIGRLMRCNPFSSGGYDPVP